MKNFIKPGDVFDYTVPAAGVSAGDLVEMGSVIGVALTDGVQDDVVSVYVSGVYEVPKAAGAVSQGDKLYYDDAAKNLTTADGSGANALAGYAYESALAGDATVKVKLLF
jgi:predicted RecA/RadA family phage recombinase